MGYKHHKEDIVKKGSELFRKQGYHKVGINDILKSCNIPKGSFYNFFESKEDFAVQVLEAYAKGSLQLIKDSLESNNPSPIGRLKDFYNSIIQDNIAEGCNSGCLINNISVELGGTNDRLSRIADEKFRDLIALIANTIAEGQKAGEITQRQSAHELAEYLHSGFFGALSRMKVNRNPIYLKKWHKMTFELIRV